MIMRPFWICVFSLKIVTKVLENEILKIKNNLEN